MLNQKGQYEEAIPILRKAIELDPKDSAAQSNLGRALSEKGEYDQAIPILQKAIDLDPKDAESYSSLVNTLLAAGRFSEVLEAARRFHQSVKPDDLQRQVSDQLVHRAEQIVELDRKLPAILRGEVKLADDSELTMFPEMCQYKTLYATSARFWLDAFTAKPRLAENMDAGHRYNAACAAAHAGSGRGRDDPPLDEEGRTRWRKRALDWLRADLEVWKPRAASPIQSTRDSVTQTLQHWLRDPDLEGLRKTMPWKTFPRRSVTSGAPSGPR